MTKDASSTTAASGLTNLLRLRPAEEEDDPTRSLPTHPTYLHTHTHIANLGMQPPAAFSWSWRGLQHLEAGFENIGSQEREGAGREEEEKAEDTKSVAIFLIGSSSFWGIDVAPPS
eukprot:GHVS01102081.1.p2 GENE.GHVS01102081.1~~GHVS01102081.1.p2  ORF type:complete len:116 (+),score=25.63 GHVS01102081.1:1277-1624(+)